VAPANEAAGKNRPFCFFTRPVLKIYSQTLSDKALCFRAKQAMSDTMKNLDLRLSVRTSAPLREELKRAAGEDGRSVSDVVRKILVSWASEQMRRRFEQQRAA
jgi:hypothetical protein